MKCAFVILMALAVVSSAQKIDESLLPTFTGKLHTITKKEISVETEDGNDLIFTLTRKTRFERNGANAKATDFHSGETITVRAQEHPYGNMMAIVVNVEPLKQAPH